MAYSSEPHSPPPDAGKAWGDRDPNPCRSTRKGFAICCDLRVMCNRVSQTVSTQTARRSTPTDPRADHAGVPALRAALDCADDPVLSKATMTPVELRAKLDECERDRARSRYAQMTAALPELLQHAYVLAADARLGVESELAWSLLSDAYMLAQTVSFRFGHLDLAALSNEP